MNTSFIYTALYQASWFLPFIYAPIFVCYASILFLKRSSSSVHSLCSVLLPAGLFIHAFILLVRYVVLAIVPFSSIYDAFSTLAFCLLSLYFLVEFKSGYKGTGFFMTGIALVILLFSALVQQPASSHSPASLLDGVHLVQSAGEGQPTQPTLLATGGSMQSHAFALHAFLAILGYTGLGGGAIYAWMYLLQHRNLKKHSTGILFRHLPSVEHLYQMSTQMIAAGITGLGGGIVLGYYYAYSTQMYHAFVDPKSILTSVFWVLYVGVFFMNAKGKISSKWSAVLWIAGFVGMMLSVAFAMVIWESFHAFS